MKISVLTPTADRPIAFALAERYMARQTLQPDEWIVADGGEQPTQCTMAQVHIHRPHPAGAENFARNLLNGISRATGDLLVVVEDDDFYAPNHIERLAAIAERFPLVGSEPVQNYYNVAQRCWRAFNNVGASMCQTAIRRELWPDFEKVIRTCMARGTYGIDTTFWRSVPTRQWGMSGKRTVVGIKGLPGRAGLGCGHRPGAGWTADPGLAQLIRWIGDEAETYADYTTTAMRLSPASSTR